MEEGTGFVELRVSNDPAARPQATLNLSVVGHIIRTGKVTRGQSECGSFGAESFWNFPTSLSGDSLGGVIIVVDGTPRTTGEKPPGPLPGEEPSTWTIPWGWYVEVQ